MLDELVMTKHLTAIQIKRISNAEKACKNATTNEWKELWFDVFRKLCTKYNCTEYFKKVMH